MFGFLEGWSVDNLKVMIVSVVRYTHWPPETIDKLYLDDLDHHGLLYWYYDAKEQEKLAKEPNVGNN